MSLQHNPIHTEDLVAFADGQLDPARARLVAIFLNENPAAAQQVEAYRQQSAELHRQFDPSLSAPIPHYLLPPERSSFELRKNLATTLSSRWSWAIAASLAWVILGISLGWILKGQQSTFAEPSVLAGNTLLHQASIAHAVYAPEVMHPVEVTAKDEVHLAKWLSKRLDRKLDIPSFSTQGFSLIGGRLLPTDSNNAAAQFMYENKHGQRLTLYVRAMAEKDADTSFRYGENKGIGVFYWVDQEWGYALSGPFDRKTLFNLADTAYRQFNL